MSNNEYNQIYGTENYGGYLFFYHKRHISNSHYLEPYQIKSIPPDCLCFEKLSVVCKHCSTYMICNDSSNGYFECIECRKKVRKSTLFHKLESEIDKEEAMYEDYDEYY